MSQSRAFENLSRNQKKAVKALLTNKTIGEAAEDVGVNRKTIQRWMKETDFLEALQVEEGRYLDQAARELIVLALKATTALDDVLENPTQEGASQKRLAAKHVLENVLRLWELRNLEVRLGKLERKIENV